MIEREVIITSVINNGIYLISNFNRRLDYWEWELTGLLGMGIVRTIMHKLNSWSDKQEKWQVNPSENNAFGVLVFITLQIGYCVLLNANIGYKTLLNSDVGYCVLVVPIFATVHCLMPILGTAYYSMPIFGTAYSLMPILGT